MHSMIVEEPQAAVGLTGASAVATTGVLCEMLLGQGRVMRRETARRAVLTAGPVPGVGEWG